MSHQGPCGFGFSDLTQGAHRLRPAMGRHRKRQGPVTVLLIGLGAVTLVATIVAAVISQQASGGGPRVRALAPHAATSRVPASRAARPAASTPRAATSGAAAAHGPLTTQVLNPRLLRFVTDVRSALKSRGLTIQSSDAQVADLGARLCAARRAKTSQAAVIARLAAQSPQQYGISPAQVTTTAEADLCRRYLPASPQVIARFQGHGSRDSGLFAVTAAVTVRYSFACQAKAGPGTFIADLISGNKAGARSDEQPVADRLRQAGSGTMTLHPLAGRRYRLAVSSECRWSMVVTPAGHPARARRR